MSEAAYFDGLSAARRAARLAFEADALAICEPSGAPLARWPYAGLRSPERLAPGRLARLACAEAPDARLHVVDAAAVAELLRRAPHLAKGSDELSWRGVALAAAVSVGALAGLYLAVPLAVAPLAKAIPIEWEEELGLKIAESLSPGKPCYSPAGWNALDALGEPLAEAADFEPGFYIRIVADERSNAFAAPGARIVLLQGLLAEAETPDEVAGVIAHEMGHVMERHPTSAALRAMGLQALLGALFGDGGGLSAALVGAGGVLAQLSYSREDEREADRIAGEILQRAGVSPAGLARFFERAAKADGAALPDYVSTHPAPLERAARFADAPARPPVLDAEEWAALKSICD